MSLDGDALLDAAGESGFARGESYVRYVRGLHADGERATATVQARNVYVVELDWSGAVLRGRCTCPHHERGFFCKHLVALGLCVLDSTPRLPPVVDDDEVAALVAELDEATVREVLADAARRDATLRRELSLRRAAGGGDDAALAAELRQAARSALSPRGFIDYRRSFEVAADIESVLDEMARCLDAGAAEAVRPAARYATERLRTVIGQSDDSSGVLGTACEHAAELHARACRDGRPDRRELGRWLARFRAVSPGWPDLELEPHLSALGDDGLSAYRAAVERLGEKPPKDASSFEVARMRLELADHDGDVDAAIALLQDDGRTAWGGIVARLQSVGRHDEAVAWIDRAVAEGRLGRHGPGNAYWLDPVEVAATYVDHGREEDAVEVLRTAFRRQPGAATAANLVDLGRRLGRVDELRDWAWASAREVAERSGDAGALVDMALATGDVDRAWEAAEAFGTGAHWERLAAALAPDRPLAAARLHRAQVERDLAAGADTRRYAGIARRLALVRELHRRAGAPRDFEADLAAIREQYGRRSSLMRRLDEAGLVAAP